MSFVTHVCHWPRQIEARKDHIWICEDVLNSVLRQFAHRQAYRRNVSFFPGPLEARKRASKRRMVNVAPAADSSALDPSLLAGLGKHGQGGNWHWQRPSQTSDKSLESQSQSYVFAASQKAEQSVGASLLPSCLTGLPPPPPPPPPQQEPLYEPASLESSSQPTLYTKERNVFVERLKLCKDVPSLRRLSTDTGIEIRDYSRLGFRQLLLSEQPIPALLGFLEDPYLNRPKARNLKLFLEWHWNKCMNDGERTGFLDQVVPWIESEINVGKLSLGNIQHLVQFVSYVGTTSEDEDIKCRLAKAILGGLNRSHVFTFSEIKANTIAELLGALTTGIFTWQSQMLGHEIVHSLHELQKGALILRLSESILESFQSMAFLEQGGHTTSTNVVNIRTFFRVSQMLPSEMKRLVIARISRTLIDLQADARSCHSTWSEVLNLWWSSLAQYELFRLVSPSGLDSGIPRKVSSQSVEVIAQYLRHLNRYEEARFLLRYWWNASRSTLKLFDDLHARNEVLNSFAIMLKLVKFVPLEPGILSKLFDLLKLLQDSDSIIHIISRSRLSGIQVPIGIVLGAIRNHQDVGVHYSQKLFRSDPRILIEECPELAERLIKDHKLHPKLLWVYLRLKRTGVEVAISGNPYKLRKARASIYEMMALEISQRRDLTPRTRFRYVYKCYMQCKKEGLVRRDMSRALTWSGIIASLQIHEWVNTSKLRQILSVVRSVEGDDEADEVDRIVYDWRGDAIRHMRYRMRQHRISGNSHRPTVFDIGKRRPRLRRAIIKVNPRKRD